MSLTHTRIIRFCSISSTVAALPLCTVLFAKSQEVSFRESATQAEDTTQSSDRSSDLASRTWNEAVNLEISQEYQLIPMVSPVEPIDWDNTKIEIDTDFSLDF